MRLRLIFISLFFSSTLSARIVNGDRDFQFWPHQSFEKKWKEKGSWTLNVEERFGGGAAIFYHAYIQTNFRANFTKWLEFAPGYRQTFTRPGDRWTRVYEPMLIVTLRKEWRNWEWNFRNQNQYRIFEDSDPLWLCRARGRIFFPVHFGKKVRPYIENEIFFLEKAGFVENRFALGLRFPWFYCLSSDFVYMFRSMEVAEGWINQRIFRFFLTYTF